MATLRLKRLQIDRFRNVAPGTVLEFNDGMNVLLGPNGSGKTTLLRLIAAVALDDFSSLVDEELDISYEAEIAASLLRIHFVLRRENGHHGRRAASAGSAVSWQFEVSLVGSDGTTVALLEASPLSDRYNEALARGFNADVVLAANASYAAAVMDTLENAPQLLAALERTTEP